MIYTAFDTPWGVAGFVERDGRMVASWLPGLPMKELRRAIEEAWTGVAFEEAAHPRWRDAVRRYYEGARVDFGAIPVELDDCTPFRRRVLNTLRSVPWGTLTTYGELACRGGSPGAARAVGGVVASNPLPLIIPCHRVVAQNGRLGGFSVPGGVEVKRRMLALEGIVLEKDKSF